MNNPIQAKPVTRAAGASGAPNPDSLLALSGCCIRVAGICIKEHPLC